MAQGTTTVRVKLDLTQEEASYLKGLLQNDLLDKETLAQAVIREEIFNAIPTKTRLP